ncbi:hypothetical protein [Microcoleus sp. F4-D5]|uniref:hypothetical protein n=1 Tax=Microcoleus sp. F4-D5 TaxID=2818760 RepID=UPI002FD77B18
MQSIIHQPGTIFLPQIIAIRRILERCNGDFEPQLLMDAVIAAANYSRCFVSLSSLKGHRQIAAGNGCSP